MPAAIIAAKGILTGLEILSGLLTVAAEAQAAAIKVNLAMQKAKDEGRDVTPEELAQAAEQRHALEADLIARLRGSAAHARSGTPTPSGDDPRGADNG
jgi:hypothetical protein